MLARLYASRRVRYNQLEHPGEDRCNTVFILVFVQAGILPTDRGGVLRAFHHIFGVGGNEGAAMIVDRIGVL
jgi:hypothetical protein